MHVIKRHTPHAQSRERESASTHVCETMCGGRGSRGVGGQWEVRRWDEIRPS